MGQAVKGIEMNDGYSEFRYFDEKELKTVFECFN